MEWAKSQLQLSKKLSRQNAESQRQGEDGASWTSVEPVYLETGFGALGDAALGDLLETHPAHGNMTWEPVNLDLSGCLLENDALPLRPVPSDDDLWQDGMYTQAPEELTSESSSSNLFLQDFSGMSSDSSRQQPKLDLGVYHSIAHVSRASPKAQSMSSTSPRRVSDDSWASFGLHPSPSWNSSQSSLSPFSIDQQMITRSNSLMTSANLLRIYHDVLEHNLSCWLSEVTCPYQKGPRNTANAVPEWGPSWTNRIYQRTVRLDRIAQSHKILQLTRSEDRAASKALNLVIMAFATQWAQGSHRHHERYTVKSPFNEMDGIEDRIAEEFDRTLQQQVWNQAQCALQEVADLESYRVACAELIFGLTQKPWDMDDHSSGPEAHESNPERVGSSVLSQIREIIHKEGPPIYMERAARKMHALKYRCDTLEIGLAKPFTSGQKGAHSIGAVSAEDRSTIGLLYWLAIMFDTISSTMNERPVVVLDEDCQYELKNGPEQATGFEKSAARKRWDLGIFIQETYEEIHSTHWPCSYEAAAEDITKSAPIKVLLYRHLSYLQNALRKGVDKTQIEEIICSTTALYKYWNKTHGAFFRELTQDYNAIPQRIQGWFVCISAHWHLASMMFADLLDFVDDGDFGMEDMTKSRQGSRMAGRIREDSAKELSDLARVATPPTKDNAIGSPQMPDFHHAVNEATILTEPWTMILIRAFTKACVIFLGEADDFLRHGKVALGHDSHEWEMKMERAENCTKGLWLLGKKSDMARKLAETLSMAFGKLSDEYAG